MSATPSRLAMEKLLNGTLADTKANGICLSYQRSDSGGIRMTLSIVDKDGCVLVYYAPNYFEINEGDTVRLCNIDRLFSFTLANS